jgi:glycosyltransferase involved in cell wall biosynthesis
MPQMRVLAANKFYFVKGGAERYFFELKRILEERGDEVIPFAMRHEANEPCEHSDLFASREDFEDGVGVMGRLRAAARVVYSMEARRRIEELVDRTRPDVAHLHNIAHQLSPSILYGLRAKGVPVVQTLHDYKLVCPNYQMFVDGETCERCREWRYFNAVARRCMRDSLSRSITVCVEAYVHRLLRTYERNVAAFIAPSRSLRDRMIAHGVDAERIEHVPYAIELGAYEPRYESDGYAVYVGRLSAGKGVEALLAAAALARDVRLKVAGTGPLEGRLRTAALTDGLDNVEFVGHRTGDDLRSLFSGALFVVVPSECYENSPLTIYEALAYGKAVVGSTMGGIPELLKAGETGLIFEAGDHEALARCLRELWADPARTTEMGRRGRRRAEIEYTPEGHYRRIREIYERVAT